MKIKKFIAPDIRRAIKMVRDEQGPDAVIISNRRVEGGVEIISAADYDEELIDSNSAEFNGNALDKNKDSGKGDALTAYSAVNGYAKYKNSDDSSDLDNSTSAKIDDRVLTELRQELKYLRSIVENRFFDFEWLAYSNNNPINAEIIKRLINSGISIKLAKDIVKDLPYTDSIERGWSSALRLLSQKLSVINEDILDNGGVIALVGPTGVGKTTTVAKLAARYALRRGVRHVSLITTDNYRVGAHEQLRTYGRLLDIPVKHALNKEELQAHLDDSLNKDLVLIDTAGMSQRDIRLSEQLAVLKETKSNMKVFLVLSATSQLDGLNETINVFRDVQPDGCIITKLDESTTLGPVLSAIIDKNITLAYVSDGQRVPEDLHLARVDRLINEENFNIYKDKEGENNDELLRFTMGRTLTNAH